MAGQGENAEALRNRHGAQCVDEGAVADCAFCKTAYGPAR